MNRHAHTRSPARCLSLHAGYQCRHAGACCAAGWHIPAEAPVVAAIRLHFGGRSTPAFQSAPAPDGTAILATRRGGACAFFDEPGGRLCEIHRDLGEPMLPSACRHFPRVVLTDPRGTFVTLSHFCPTAAALLFSERPLVVVDAPDSLTLHGAVEGLDATAALPPLLRPGMLADHDGYDAWERAGIDLVMNAGRNADAALAALAATTDAVARWSPGSASLRDHVAGAFAAAAGRLDGHPGAAGERLVSLALASVPAGLAVPALLSSDDAPAVDPASAGPLLDRVVRRYLASKLFGSWWPYLGLDLTGVVVALRTHAAVLRRQFARHLSIGGPPAAALRDAIRETDLLMVHLADQPGLARLLGGVR